MTKLLTITDVADVLSVSKSFVYDLVDCGELPYVRVGKAKCLRFDPEDIEAFIRRRKMKSEGKRPPASRPRLKHIKL